MKSAAAIVALTATLAALVKAAPLAAQKQSGYAGSETCITCHEAVSDSFKVTKKGPLFLSTPKNETEKLGCEGCHGPGAAHVAEGGKRRAGMVTFAAKDSTPVERRNRVCLECHDASTGFKWVGHESSRFACTNCHRTMSVVSPTGQLQFATVAKTCARCHAGKKMDREHAKVRTADWRAQCGTCHNPHAVGDEDEKGERETQRRR